MLVAVAVERKMDLLDQLILPVVAAAMAADGILVLLLHLELQDLLILEEVPEVTQLVLDQHPLVLEEKAS
jgi:hypothetical protein